MLSSCAEDTQEIARQMGRVLTPGDVVALTGDLGSGKTVFCKGIGEALAIPPDRIVSPSFTIVAEHRGDVLLYHVDVYRLHSEREAADIGLDEILYGEGISVVEWADRITSMLPNNCIKVKFLLLSGTGRRLIISAEDGPRMQEFAERCRRYLPGG